MGWSRRTDREVSPPDATLLLEPFDDLLNLLHVLDAVPEQGSTGTGETSVSAFEMPAAVFIVSTGKPEQLAVVPFDRIEDVVHYVVHDTPASGEEMGHDRNLALWSRDDSDSVEGLVTVYCKRMFLEVVQDTGYAVVPGLDVGVAVVDDLTKAVSTHTLDGVVLEELIASSNESSSTAVGEELLLQRGRGDNGDGGSTG